MDAPTSGSAANVTTLVADDEYPTTVVNTGERDNVTHLWPDLQE